MLDDLLSWFFVDLLRTPRRRKIAAYAISYAATAVLLAIIAFAVNWFTAPQVHAATPDVCELVASPAGIDTYFCEPPGAPPFYENEFGFMQIVP